MTLYIVVWGGIYSMGFKVTGTLRKVDGQIQYGVDVEDNLVEVEKEELDEDIDFSVDDLFGDDYINDYLDDISDCTDSRRPEKRVRVRVRVLEEEKEELEGVEDLIPLEDVNEEEIGQTGEIIKKRKKKRDKVYVDNVQRYKITDILREYRRSKVDNFVYSEGQEGKVEEIIDEYKDKRMCTGKQHTVRQNKLEDWVDFWVRGKEAGYFVISNAWKGFNKLVFDVEDIKDYIGMDDWYISLNAFKPNNVDGIQYSRRTKQLAQIRVIGVDIDQYDIGISKRRVLKELDKMIGNGDIPKPNLITQSRGTQLFWSIKGGASPDMWWLVNLITEDFITKTLDLGADVMAKGATRLMRLPGSYNSRDGSMVRIRYKNKKEYTLQDLRKYIETKEEDKTKGKNNRKRHGKVRDVRRAVDVMYRVNQSRLDDLDRLIDLRGGYFPRMRNRLYYIYAFQYSIVQTDIRAVRDVVLDKLEDIYCDDGELDYLEVNKTIESAFKGARAYVTHIMGGGRNKEGDGIVKPYNTNTLIRDLRITKKEMESMYYIVDAERHQEAKMELQEQRRREQGIRPMEEYNEERKDKKEILKDRLREFDRDKSKDKGTVKDLAVELGVTRQYIYKLRREIKLEDKVVILDVDKGRELEEEIVEKSVN